MICVYPADCTDFSGNGLGAVTPIEALDGRNIRLIAANTEESGGEPKTLRVAAYCRVSTDDIDQAISIALQIKEYKQKIKANPNWKYVGTYVEMKTPSLIQFNDLRRLAGRGGKLRGQGG